MGPRVRFARQTSLPQWRPERKWGVPIDAQLAEDAVDPLEGLLGDALGHEGA